MGRAAGRIEGFFRPDVAQHPGTARQLGIQATPTILLIKDGHILRAMGGMASRP
jgi:thioredoxin-like negative regulator of GroEL